MKNLSAPITEHVNESRRRRIVVGQKYYYQAGDTQPCGEVKELRMERSGDIYAIMETPGGHRFLLDTENIL